MSLTVPEGAPQPVHPLGMAFGGQLPGLVEADVDAPALHHGDELVEQVGLVQRDLVPQVLDAFELLGGGPADHAVDLVALVEQQLSEIRAVLAGDAGDKRSF